MDNLESGREANPRAKYVGAIMLDVFGGPVGALDDVIEKLNAALEKP